MNQRPQEAEQLQIQGAVLESVCRENVQDLSHWNKVVKGVLKHASRQHQGGRKCASLENVQHLL